MYVLVLLSTLSCKQFYESGSTCLLILAPCDVRVIRGTRARITERNVSSVKCLLHGMYMKLIINFYLVMVRTEFELGVDHFSLVSFLLLYIFVNRISYL